LRKNTIFTTNCNTRDDPDNFNPKVSTCNCENNSYYLNTFTILPKYEIALKQYAIIQYQIFETMVTM